MCWVALVSSGMPTGTSLSGRPVSGSVCSTCEAVSLVRRSACTNRPARTVCASLSL